MQLDTKTQWLLTPVQTTATKGATLKAFFKRRLLVPLVVLLAYWIGTHHTDSPTAPAPTPRPAYTQPAAGGEHR